MTPKTDLEIIIADDSEISREGLKAITKSESDIKLRTEVTSGKELLTTLKKGIIPDVILLNICLDKDDKSSTLTESNRTYPYIKIIILTHNTEIKNIVKAIQNNVRAYLAKDSTRTEIINTIKDIRLGNGVYFGETISKNILIKGFGNKRNIINGKPHELSLKKVKTLRRLAFGQSVKEKFPKHLISVAQQ